MRYRRLTLKERYHIETLIKQGYKQKEIADELETSASTISRELRRNKIRGKYRAEQAHTRCTLRQKKKRRHTVINKAIEKYIREKLALDWSPEQISGRMKLDINKSIHHETIYQFIYRNKANGGRLYKYLRHKNKKYDNRTNQYARRGIIIDRVMIDERPKIVEQKSRIGDLEIDTVIGANHKGALVTVVDRMSKFTLIQKVDSKQASVVTSALIKMLSPIQCILKTITSDNGKEFAYHKQVSQTLNTNFYFANPYHSWERGLNEHTNGLIRQYIPKKSEFDNISKEQIVTIAHKLNHRPRKSLGFKTPFEVFMHSFSKNLVA